MRWDAFGDGPPVVLVHGTPFSSYVWHDIARALAGSHRVFVWDLLGYGASAKHAGQDVSLAAQTRVFAALLDHWRLVEPAVVAHGFGGATALRTLLLERRRFSRLALVDAVAVAPWGTGLFRLVQQHAGVFAELPATHHEAVVRAHIRTAAHQALPAPVEDALVAPWLGLEGQAAHYRQVQQNSQRFTDDVQNRYPEIDIPVMIVWGEQGAWLPTAHAHQLHDLIPGSRLRFIPDAGHLVQFDAPATLTAELLAFLTETGGRER